MLLTEKREELLEGNYDSGDNADRMAKSRLHSSTNTAIQELVKIAESPYISNSEVFDPDDIFRLLRALLIPSNNEITDEASALIGADAEVTDEYRAFNDRLRMQMAKLIIEDSAEWTEENAPEWEKR